MIKTLLIVFAILALSLCVTENEYRACSDETLTLSKFSSCNVAEGRRILDGNQAISEENEGNNVAIENESGNEEVAENNEDDEKQAKIDSYQASCAYTEHEDIEDLDAEWDQTYGEHIHKCLIYIILSSEEDCTQEYIDEYIELKQNCAGDYGIPLYSESEPSSEENGTEDEDDDDDDNSDDDGEDGEEDNNNSSSILQISLAIILLMTLYI